MRLAHKEARHSVSQAVPSPPLIEQEEEGEFDSHLHQNSFVRLGAKKKKLKVKSALRSTPSG